MLVFIFYSFTIRWLSDIHLQIVILINGLDMDMGNGYTYILVTCRVEGRGAYIRQKENRVAVGTLDNHMLG